MALVACFQRNWVRLQEAEDVVDEFERKLHLRQPVIALYCVVFMSSWSKFSCLLVNRLLSLSTLVQAAHHIFLHTSIPSRSILSMGRNFSDMDGTISQKEIIQ